MRALQLDFAPRRRMLHVLGTVALLGALAACGYLVYLYMSLSTEMEAWEAQWQRTQKALKTQAEPRPMPKAEWDRLQAELKAANRVIARLNLPWDAFFREIESSVNEHVTLLSVEPDTEKHEVRIVAEARDFAAMLEYERRLQAASVLREAYIASHQLQVQDPQRPVRFVVIAQWLQVPGSSNQAATDNVANAGL